MSHPNPQSSTRPGPRTTDTAAGATPSGPNVPLPPAPAPSGPALCGRPHTYKTRGGETKTKACVKAKGHEGSVDGSKCSSRAQNQKVDLSVLADVELSAEEVPASDLLDVLTERVRDAQQLRTDADVALGWDKWKKAGKPTGINDAIAKGAASRYLVAPEQVAAVRTVLRRAENAPELKGKVHVKIPPVKTHTSGKKMIYFIVVDKREKPASLTK